MLDVKVTISQASPRPIPGTLVDDSFVDRARACHEKAGEKENKQEIDIMSPELLILTFRMDFRAGFALALLTEKVTPLFFDWAANSWRSLPFLPYTVSGLQDLGYT